jgi:hypothetical protein
MNHAAVVHVRSRRDEAIGINDHLNEIIVGAKAHPQDWQTCL